MTNAKAVRTAAFQGYPGAYSDLAVRKLFGDSPELVPCGRFEDVFDAVASGRAETGVLPIENSLTGPIYRNYDLQLQCDLWIGAETEVRIAHNLIVFPGVEPGDIRRVYSHPQGLAQCQKYLSQHPEWEQIPAEDTAGSVKIIKENGWRDAAAIAGRHAADYYGMSVVAENIEDIEQNHTRFIALFADSFIPDDADKTSIAFSTEHVPGALFKSLSVFALRDIGLSKIESRPVHGTPWRYVFYADVEESLANQRCVNAVFNLKETTKFVKILGSYKHGLESHEV